MFQYFLCNMTCHNQLELGLWVTKFPHSSHRYETFKAPHFVGVWFVRGWDICRKKLPKSPTQSKPPDFDSLLNISRPIMRFRVPLALYFCGQMLQKMKCVENLISHKNKNEMEKILHFTNFTTPYIYRHFLVRWGPKDQLKSKQGQRR